MILIDDREDRALLHFFRPFDVTIESTRLEYGDFCWAGNGPDGDCLVGVERKTIRDLVNSMRSKRLSGYQLQGLCEMYNFVYLLVEGQYRPTAMGTLETNTQGGWYSLGLAYREVDAYLSTLEQMTPLVVRRSESMYETATQIANLYKWWTNKEWREHKAHQTLYAPAGELGHKARFISAEEMIRRQYGEETVIAWKFASQLPGIDKKAEAVAVHFRLVDRMVNATEKEWRMVDGIGKILAKRFVGLIHGTASECENGQALRGQGEG